MIANSEKGEVILGIGDGDYIVCFDYTAIEALRSEYGNDYEVKLGDACNERDVMTLAKVIEIGLQKHHNDSLSFDDIVKISPPILPVINAINSAYNLAQFGNVRGQESDENPTMLSRIKTAWKILFSKRRILHIIME